MRTTTLAVLLVTVASWAPCEATVIRVPSQAPSIQAAVNWSVSGDTLLIEPGVYTGTMNRHIEFSGKNVTIRSEAGPDVTIVDCEGFDLAFWVNGGVHEVIEGLTLRNGSGVEGGAMLIRNDSSATVRSCNFIDNGATYGGALYCSGVGSQGVFEDCRFLGNAAVGAGVASAAIGHVEFVDCEFVGNSSTGSSGVFHETGSHYGNTHIAVVRCLFRDNTGITAGVFQQNYLWQCSFSAHDCVFEANHSGAAIMELGTAYSEFSQCLFARNVAETYVISNPWGSSLASVSGSTFAENTAPSGVFGSECYGSISTTIVAFTVSGPAILSSDPPTFTCCDFFGNEGGDWVGGVADQLGVDGNICMDPLFCGDANPELPYSLHADSPCAAANSGGCGTIGRWDEGCDVTVVESSTWGSIKAMYR